MKTGIMDALNKITKGISNPQDFEETRPINYDITAYCALKELKTIANLTTLNLGFNSIGDNGVLALSNALKINSTLTTLDTGSQALAEALKTNSTLTKFYLWGNVIGADGALVLSEALKINSTLITFDFQNNSVKDDWVQALAEALKANSTLINLDLQNNSIGDDGAQALAEALKINATLTGLYLQNNLSRPPNSGISHAQNIPAVAQCLYCG
ncbi:hypothetical protein BGZ82_001264, partial [Podila clonocystis]